MDMANCDISVAGVYQRAVIYKLPPLQPPWLFGLCLVVDAVNWSCVYAVMQDDTMAAPETFDLHPFLL